MSLSFQQLNAARARAAAIRPVRGELGRQGLLALYPKLRLTTAEAYHEALSDQADNEAGQQIDAGREPYLEPFIPVFDVLAERQRVGTGRRFGHADFIALDLPAGPCLVPADALLAWR
jgi:hypothetical protein